MFCSTLMMGQSLSSSLTGGNVHAVAAASRKQAGECCIETDFPVKPSLLFRDSPPEALTPLRWAPGSTCLAEGAEILVSPKGGGGGGLVTQASQVFPLALTVETS